MISHKDKLFSIIIIIILTLSSAIIAFIGKLVDEYNRHKYFETIINNCIIEFYDKDNPSNKLTTESDIIIWHNKENNELSKIFIKNNKLIEIKR